MNWQLIGQVMAGISLVVTATVAVVTFRVIHVAQRRKQWADDVRALSAKFWKDEDVSLVRRWIISDLLYRENLETILMLRNARKENQMGYVGSMILDKLDQFCAQIIEFQLLADSAATSAHQRDLLKKIMPGEYWLRIALSRPELREYIENHWWEIRPPLENAATLPTRLSRFEVVRQRLRAPVPVLIRITIDAGKRLVGSAKTVIAVICSTQTRLTSQLRRPLRQSKTFRKLK
jgi:hypothetical protein